MKYILILFLTLLIISCKKEDIGLKLQSHDENKLMTMMHKMMSRMDTMQKTNDPDLDFARMMKMHHEGALNMADVEIQEGKNDSLKRIAQKMVNDQLNEIMQLNAIIGTLSVDNTDAAFTMEQMENMKKAEKSADVQLITGDIDNDFATLMIVHHQTAIDNASSYLHHGNHSQLKTMATNIVMNQTKEIQEIADWLRKNKR